MSCFMLMRWPWLDEAPMEVRGPSLVARGALAFFDRVRFAQLALVTGHVGASIAPRGRRFVVLGFTVARDKEIRIDVVADPSRLKQLELALLGAIDRMRASIDTRMRTCVVSPLAGGLLGREPSSSVGLTTFFCHGGRRRSYDRYPYAPGRA